MREICTSGSTRGNSGSDDVARSIARHSQLYRLLHSGLEKIPSEQIYLRNHFWQLLQAEHLLSWDDQFIGLTACERWELKDGVVSCSENVFWLSLKVFLEPSFTAVT